MSPHPGRIRATFDVDLPRPRDVSSLDVARKAHEISEALRAESAKGAAGSTQGEELPTPGPASKTPTPPPAAQTPPPETSSDASTAARSPRATDAPRAGGGAP
jgi:hypothetical protein